MAHRKLYAYRITIYKPASGTDVARVPAASVTVTSQKRGAFAQGTGSDTGSGSTITVHNINQINVGDLLFIGSGTTSRFVDSMTATTITLVAGGSGTYEWVDGDRFRSVGGAPKIYSDADGAEVIATGTTDSSGEVEFYSKASVLDLLLNDGGTQTLLSDVAGSDGAEDLRPELWNALRDGSTNDSASFADMMEYVVAQSGALKIKLGAGVYRLGSVWTLAALSSFEIEGQGIGVTTIEINHAGVGIDLTGACTDVVLKNLTINRLSGTADHIQVSSASVRPRVENVLFKGGGLGIDDNGSDDARYLNLFFTTGTWVTLIALNNAARPHIVELVARMAANWTRALDVSTGCTRVRLANIDISPTGAFSGIGLHIRDDAAGTDPKGVFLVNSHIAAGTSGACVEVDDGDGVVIDSCEFTNSNRAIQIDGGDVITISGCQVDTMENEAVDINATASVTIVGLASVDVSQTGSGTASHIHIAANIDQVTIVACLFKHRAGSNLAKMGVEIAAGASDSVIIIGSRIGSATGGAPGILNGSTTNSNTIGHTIFAQQTEHGPLSGLLAVKTLAGTETTLDVRGIRTVVFAQSGATTFTNFTNAVEGTELTLIFENGNTTLQEVAQGGNFQFPSNADYVGSTNDGCKVIFTGGGKWIQVSRSDN